MTTATLHPLTVDYLERLKRASRGLPRVRRRELLAEIEAHLSEAIEPTADEAQVLTVLDRLGDPNEIVEAEMPERSANHSRRGGQEWAAIFLLLFGGFFAGIGWVIGLVLLWSSKAWTTRDKWIGTLIIPGGLGILPYLLLKLSATSRSVCSGPVGDRLHCTTITTSSGVDILALAGLILVVLLPIATAIYLAKRAT